MLEVRRWKTLLRKVTEAASTQKKVMVMMSTTLLWSHTKELALSYENN
jgi:hypothetical protein